MKYKYIDMLELLYFAHQRNRNIKEILSGPSCYHYANIKKIYNHRLEINEMAIKRIKEAMKISML